MTVVGTLYQLEQLDSEIERREADLRELRRRQAKNPKLETAEARLKALTEQERRAVAEQRTLESDLNDLENKIKRDHTRMYSGQIVDSRELASLERELEHYRERQGELEERCLEGMERVEQLQTEVQTLSNEVRDLRQHWESDQPDMAQRTKHLVEQAEDLRARRGELAATVDPRSLDMYRRLRASLGHAVSLVSGGICQACRVSIPPKDIQHARGDQIATCSNCARILYVG